MSSQNLPYIFMVSPHGLLRATDVELGHDSDTGGQIEYVLSLAKELSKYAYVEIATRNITDWGLSSDYSVPLEQINDNCQIVRIEAGTKDYIRKEDLWPHLPEFIQGALSWFQKQGRLPNFLHGHYADGGEICAKLSSIMRVPMAYTVHSSGKAKLNRLLEVMNFEEINSMYNINRRILAEQIALDQAKFFICNSIEELKYVSKNYKVPKSCHGMVLCPGVALPKATPIELIKAKLLKQFKQPQKKIIFALARSVPEKNMYSALLAYAISLRVQSEANLLMISGNGGDETSTKVKEELYNGIQKFGLTGKALLLKEHKREDITAIFAMIVVQESKGCFINVAYYEPFGLTFLEAAFSGCPFVATNSGGAKEICRTLNSGILVNPRIVPQIEQALHSLCSDSSLWEAQAANSVKNVNFYSWEGHVAKYLAMLKWKK